MGPRKATSWSQVHTGAGREMYQGSSGDTSGLLLWQLEQGQVTLPGSWTFHFKLFLHLPEGSLVPALVSDLSLPLCLLFSHEVHLWGQVLCCELSVLGQVAQSIPGVTHTGGGLGQDPHECAQRTCGHPRSCLESRGSKLLS